MSIYKNVFIGIPLPKKFEVDYFELINSLKSISPNLSYPKKENPHLTILFLGDQEEKHFKNISTQIEKYLILLKNVKIKLSGIGSFGSNSPKVCFIKAIKNHQVGKFREDLCDELKTILPKELKGFIPHLTLARVNSYKTSKELAKNMAEFSEIVSKIYWEFEIEEIYLYGRTSSKDCYQKILFKYYV
ncbi:RNA 2',3'-cyclic phosphodiesterase [Patescibacteria group bacterium]